MFLFFSFIFFLVFCLIFSFSFKDKKCTLEFLTLGMVKGGITRDAFTQKVAANGAPRLSQPRHLACSASVRVPIFSFCFVTPTQHRLPRLHRVVEVVFQPSRVPGSIVDGPPWQINSGTSRKGATNLCLVCFTKTQEILSRTRVLQGGPRVMPGKAFKFLHEIVTARPLLPTVLCDRTCNVVDTTNNLRLPVVHAVLMFVPGAGNLRLSEQANEESSRNALAASPKTPLPRPAQAIVFLTLLHVRVSLGTPHTCVPQRPLPSLGTACPPHTCQCPTAAIHRCWQRIVATLSQR